MVQQLITARQARELLGGVSEMTLWRWSRAHTDFPKPYRIGRRKFYDEHELQQWLEQQREAA